MNNTLWNSVLHDLAVKSYRKSDNPFKLSSGAESNEYVDCAAALSDPKTLQQCGFLVANALEGYGNVSMIGGPSNGADPIAISACLAIGRRRPFSSHGWFGVRKEAKKGKGLVEPPFKQEAVCIVDDVVTTGASTIRAIKAVQEETDSRIALVVILVNRGFTDPISGMSGVELIQQVAPVPVISVFHLDDIRTKSCNICK